MIKYLVLERICPILKIAIPNNDILTTLSWNKSKGYISCGGENGSLRVLKLDPQNDGNVRGIAAPTTLTMNESLQEHSANLTAIVWNEKFEKMTTADEAGVIIVWILFKGQWHQEMINNANKSRVNGMKWNQDGERICIVYDDGAIIVGSVDGSRLWGKTITDKLAHVEWSPDNRLLLLGLTDGQIHIYDCGGTKFNTLRNFCQPEGGQTEEGSEPTTIVSIDWYKGDQGYSCKDCPCLAICYTNGCCQIMRNETDEYPVLINTGIDPHCMAWNSNGTVLAIAGLQVGSSSNKESNLIQFYNSFGFHLRTLKIPSKRLHAVSWDGDSLHLAVAVDASIYFANIRPSHMWAFCRPDTLVFATTRPDKCNYFVTFWCVAAETKYTKTFGKLKGIISNGNLCCIICQPDTETSKSKKMVETKFTLQVCNSIGTPIDSVEVSFEPTHFAMVQSHVVVACANLLYCWQFKRPENMLSLDSKLKKMNTDIYHHIDSEPGVAASLRETKSGPDPESIRQLLRATTQDPVCCLCASGRVLVMARESGQLCLYSLPGLVSLAVQGDPLALHTRPFKMELNCTGTRLASIDFGGLLTFFDLDRSEAGMESEVVRGHVVENFEHKDVWDMKFSEDNPLLFVMMEKAKMRIIRELEAEEPLVFSGYLCEFKDLEVTAALLDEVISGREELDKSFLVTLETKILRDCRQLLQDGQFEKAQQLIEDNPHNKMWKMLAEYALEKLDLDMAEQAFVRYTCYPGIRFVKRLQKIQNNTLKMAEVSAYFGRYEEAEQRLTAIDRPDLTVAMLKSIGEWSRVLHLMKTAESASDAEMSEAWNAIGYQYFDKHDWQQAASYFIQGRCHERLVECYYHLEDYIGLERLAQSLPETSALLPKIADIFFNVGMCDQAVYAYVKCEQVKDAIDCCIRLNQWQTATELARTKDTADIGGLLSRYARQLLEARCYVQAVELYRRAGCFLDAARIISKLTEDEAKKSRNYQKLKKMSVLVGLLVEQHHEQNKQLAKSRLKDVKGQEAASALDGMLREDLAGGGGGAGDPSTGVAGDSRLLDQPWHRAEAYHFFLLAQRQLFERYYDAAMKTARLLADYEDVLPPRDIYSLLAICAIHNRAFGTCSRAFSRLESLNSFSKKEKDNLTQLTFKIFTKYSPVDPPRAREYEDIEKSFDGDSKIPICIVSGQQISLGQFWMCPVCKHSALEEEINKLHNCPFCHSAA